MFQFGYLEMFGAGEMAVGAWNGADKVKRSGLLVIIAESSPTSKATSGYYVRRNFKLRCKNQMSSIVIIVFEFNYRQY